MSKIELITHPYSVDLLQARTDYAIITGAEMVERPNWFKNTETGQLYYDLFACIGWPSEVTDSSDGLPGYAAIVGVVRPNDSTTNPHDPLNANFQLLAEAESKDVPTLLKECIRLRKEYGFGVQKNLLRVWLGDPERFYTPLALCNEGLIKDGGERAAILITPPDDFYAQKIFDSYVRALRSTLLGESRRFYFGYNDILQNRLREFKKDDPCVFAVGGLVYTLLCRCRWMDAQGENAFTVEDENEF
ncbi:MAG: hypothetical protein KAV87_03360 [Desulfobacteraceae bacterium]|nr:hypothetical protein [Desulfobacteraceae bacterium]